MSLFNLLVIYPLAALGALQIVWVGRHVYMYWPRNWPRFGIIQTEFFWCDHCGRGRVEDGGGHYSDCPHGACKHPSRVQPQGPGPIYCRLCGVEVDSL